MIQKTILALVVCSILMATPAHAQNVPVAAVLVPSGALETIPAVVNPSTTTLVLARVYATGRPLTMELLAETAFWETVIATSIGTIVLVGVGIPMVYMMYNTIRDLHHTEPNR
jgi:hypothetical protein